MNHDDWIQISLICIWSISDDKLMVLFHSLEEQCCIHAEREDLLQISHIMIKEGELADGERID